ncbi:MAG: helix-turn-helix domain-containing protein [Chloroflexi bacterium]|nr:helix-turn-helix domain-containing protein [Chloroflexota bacterium]
MEPFNNDAISVDVGERLRDLREERNLSMRELARLSGLSANALSMIERSKSSPSVSTLYKLADAMAVPITAFFRTEIPQKEIVFRKGNERTRVPFHRGLWEGLGGELFSGRVEPFMLTLESGANSGRFSMAHTGHEFVLCLRGQLEYRIENQLFLMGPGDSLLFAAELKHEWRNPGNTVTNAVFVLAGFEEGESPSEFHIAAGMADDRGDEEFVEEV